MLSISQHSWKCGILKHDEHLLPNEKLWNLFYAFHTAVTVSSMIACGWWFLCWARHKRHWIYGNLCNIFCVLKFLCVGIETKYYSYTLCLNELLLVVENSIKIISWTLKRDEMRKMMTKKVDCRLIKMILICKIQLWFVISMKSIRFVFELLQIISNKINPMAKLYPSD
jgi:hypothetical protein